MEIKSKTIGRPTKRPITTELASKYKTMTQPEIAKEYGVSIRTVARWLQRAGLSK